MLQKISGITQSAGATDHFTYTQVMPPVNNDPKLIAKIGKILKDSFEPDTITNEIPSEIGCEEFSLCFTIKALLIERIFYLLLNLSENSISNLFISQ